MRPSSSSRNRANASVGRLASRSQVALNPTVAPFNRLDVRKAAIAAIDRQELLDAVRDQGGLLASHWLPPGTPGHDEAGGAEGPRYDWLAPPDGEQLRGLFVVHA